MASGTYFLRQGSALKVVGELTWDVTSAFDQACRTLLREVASSPAVDLTGLDMMGSTHIGILVAHATEARASGKELIIKASGSLRKVIVLSGLDKLAKIEYP